MDSSPIGKICFLECYQKARIEAIVASNIKSGWKASGLWPVSLRQPLLNPMVLLSQEINLTTLKQDEMGGIDTINTPKRSSQVRYLINSLQVGPQLDLTARRLFRAIGRGLDGQNTKLAAHEAQIRRLEQQLKDSKPRKKAKVTENPNNRFIQIGQVIETRIRLAATLEPSRLAAQVQSYDFEQLCNQWQLS